MCWDIKYRKGFLKIPYLIESILDTGFSVILWRREFPTLCPVFFLFLKKYLELYFPRRIIFILYLLVLNISAERCDLNGNSNDSVPVQENHPKAQLLNKDH